jgi:hypothetical protein
MTATEILKLDSQFPKYKRESLTFPGARFEVFTAVRIQVEVFRGCDAV